MCKIKLVLKVNNISRMFFLVSCPEKLQKDISFFMCSFTVINWSMINTFFLLHDLLYGYIQNTNKWNKFDPHRIHRIK